MMKKPSLFFNKSQRNISFHFDLMHGDGNLRRAINLLGKEHKNDFLDFVNTEVSLILTICLFVNQKKFFLIITKQSSRG